MAPKQFVYAITRRDYDTQNDKTGTLTLVELHAGLDSANAAAKSHLAKESSKATDADEEAYEGTNKDGGYEGQFRTRQNKRDKFKVEVKKMELKPEASTAPKTAAASSSKATTKKRSKPEPEDEEDEGEDDDVEKEPPTKKAAPKKAAKAPAKASAKSAVPEGKSGALDGLSILFTGTFDSMDRKTSVQTAETYGATIAKKLVDADWIILGVKAGQKKLDEIEEKGLKTMDEAQFLEMLKTGEPPE